MTATDPDPDADSGGDPEINRRLDVRLEDIPEAWRFGFPILTLGYIAGFTMWLSGEYTPETWHILMIVLSLLLVASAVETWYRTTYREDGRAADPEGE